MCGLSKAQPVLLSPSSGSDEEAGPPVAFVSEPESQRIVFAQRTCHTGLASFHLFSLLRSPDLACLLYFRRGVKLELVCRAQAESSRGLECWWGRRWRGTRGQRSQVAATGATWNFLGGAHLKEKSILTDQWGDHC